MAVTHREIDASDLAAVTELLCEGFPRRSRAYWQNALAVLGARPVIDPVPQYGYLLEVDGTAEGVLLTISGRCGETVLCNLSSWYVRDAARRSSVLFLHRALRLPGVTYTDISPAKAILPLNEKLGFRPYTGGTLMAGPEALVRRGPGTVAAMAENHLPGLDPDELERLRQHVGYGCRGLVISGVGAAPAPVLYRTVRLKRTVPAARFVYGAPDLLVETIGPLARHLARQGVFVLLIDAPPNSAGGGPGRVLPDYGVRYAKGGVLPPVGDLLDTEAALFGF